MTPKSIHELRQLALDELLPTREVQVDIENGTHAIDYYFPEEFANRLSEREAYNKHLFRPNTYLHKWWARRCGSTFRTILKLLVDDNEKRDYYAAKGLEGKVVLDPMMGGGTILHEAIRLGANVVGADIDPIPVVQARASLSDVTLPEMQRAYNKFFQDIYEKVGNYFKTECPKCSLSIDAQYVLYGLRKQCSCREVIQIDRYDLRHEDGRVIYISPDGDEICEALSSITHPDGLHRVIIKADKVCPVCRDQYTDVLSEPYYLRYIPIAINGICPKHGLFFRIPGECDHSRILEANRLRAQLDFGDLGNFHVPEGPKSGDLLRRRITSYLEVFSSRQLIYLHEAIRLVQRYQGSVKLNLAVLISTSLEFNSLLCGYKGWAKQRPGAVRHVFALHAYSFPYTALENNPVNPQKASGNLQALFQDRIVRGRTWAFGPVERIIASDGETKTVRIPGEFDGGKEISSKEQLASERGVFMLLQGDSRTLQLDNGSIDFVVTDPPYYDSVQYSDLATFFRVWLSRLLPAEAEWTYDETNSAVETGLENGNDQYRKILSGIFKECGRVLRPVSGRMIFTYHHWDPKAWADLTIALKSAGFRLISTYVVFSENPISVHINNLQSLKHDTILNFGKGKKAFKYWPEMGMIDTGDSKTFCRQCGETVGWLLNTDKTTDEIRLAWQKLIQGVSR